MKTDFRLEELKKINQSEYTVIWVELNHWKFHPIISYLEPIGWETMSTKEKSLILNPLVKHIVSEVGEEACLKEANRKRLTNPNGGETPMSELDFEIWWSQKHIRDVEMLEKMKDPNYQRVLRKILGAFKESIDEENLTRNG